MPAKKRLQRSPESEEEVSLSATTRSRAVNPIWTFANPRSRRPRGSVSFPEHSPLHSVIDPQRAECNTPLARDLAGGALSVVSASWRCAAAPDPGAVASFSVSCFRAFCRKLATCRARVPRRAGRSAYVVARRSASCPAAATPPTRSRTRVAHRGRRGSIALRRWRVGARLWSLGYAQRSDHRTDRTFASGVQTRRPCSTRFHVAFTQSFSEERAQLLLDAVGSFRAKRAVATRRHGGRRRPQHHRKRSRARSIGLRPTPRANEPTSESMSPDLAPKSASSLLRGAADRFPFCGRTGVEVLFELFDRT